MKQIIFCLMLITSVPSFAQYIDSIKIKTLDEVIIIGIAQSKEEKNIKPLSSLDEYLDQSINMIKRGAYAWEPVLNNMATERTSTTIDGMKIFHACTDKMDPVTSYVEISNLKKVQITPGLKGANRNNNIGGSIDMKLNKAGFNDRRFDGNVDLGYEFNGNYRTLGTNINYSLPKFYINAGVFYRKSDDYKAGTNEKVLFSQFEKFNIYSNLGYKAAQNKIIEASFIYDDASNVGYPALTMDVASARAFIGSLSYKQLYLSDIFYEWETKAYANTITHIMDDTKRPNVPIHMDMPGWSDTFGFYSTLKGNKGKNSFSTGIDAYHNKSKAEMTMYPPDPSENAMFMYTWPDVKTFNTGVFFENDYSFNQNNTLNFSFRTSFQHEQIASELGLNSLQIFYPNLDNSKNRVLLKGSLTYIYNINEWEIALGGGYGTRAPSVSEGYGFYLFNNAENYDYIGNPNLKNEKALESNLELKYNLNKGLNMSVKSSYFYFFDYIIGKLNPVLSPMTIGASGVKIYNNIDHASILNILYSVNYNITSGLKTSGQMSYSLGKDKENDSLPLISPFTYSTQLSYNKNNLLAEVEAKGAAKQINYALKYGEHETNDYLIFNVALGYNFKCSKRTSLNLRAGVENVFDKIYSTYSDWNNIPRKGRNVFINSVVTF